MPTYEYYCTKCKKTFDAFQRMSAEPYKTCPEELCCMKKWGKGKVKRLLGSGAGLIFKGSGFYITDYRSEGYKSAEKKETSSKESSSSSKSTTENKSSSTAQGKTNSSSTSTKSNSGTKSASVKKKS